MPISSSRLRVSGLPLLLLLLVTTLTVGVNPAGAATDYRHADATPLSPSDMLAFEYDLAAIVAAEQNEARQANGRSKLTWSVAVESITGAHTDAMAARGDTYHSDLNNLINGFPTHRWAGENVLGMYNKIGEATDLWMDSPGHRENLLSTRATHMSVAVRCDDTGRTFSTVHFIEDSTAPAVPLPTVQGSATASSSCRDVKRSSTSRSSYATATGNWNPFASPEGLVNRQYRDILGTNPDSASLRYWAAEIRSGRHTRGDLVVSLINSDQFNKTVAPVARLYKAAFLRDPGPGELEFWVNGQVQKGASMSNVAWSFLNSDELRLRYGTVDDRKLITLLYNNVLGRAPDSRGFEYWLGRRASGMKAHDLMLQFANSEEFVNQTRNVLKVHLTHVTMLNRAPDQASRSYWVAQLNSGQTVKPMAKRFFDSQEYAKLLGS